MRGFQAETKSEERAYRDGYFKGMLAGGAIAFWALLHGDEELSLFWDQVRKVRDWACEPNPELSAYSPCVEDTDLDYGGKYSE